MSDGALLDLIGNFIRSHRLKQNRSQDDVAHDAGISRSTLSLLERGEKVRIDSIIQVLRVLDLLYIMKIFEVSTEISPIAYAKLKKQERLKASPNKGNIVEEEDLGW